MNIGGRSLGRIAKALVKGSQYAGLARYFSTFEHPLREMADYLLATQAYPRTITLRGGREIELRARDDLKTVSEIFCRRDYRCEGAGNFVDFGANIGVASLFYLERNPGKAYAFEPNPPNVERLRANLAPFGDRCAIFPVAVNVESGPVSFEVEPTGRYGGIGESGNTITVEGLDVNECLDRVLEHEATIDFLKVDIEKLERQILEAITPDRLARIRTIVVELGAGTIDLNGFQATRNSHILTLANLQT